MGIASKARQKMVVNKERPVEYIEVVSDIGGVCGAEAQRVNGLMPRYNIGKQAGKQIRVQYEFPTSFQFRP